MGSGSSRVLWITVFAMGSGSSRVLWITVFAMTGGSSRVMVHGICNGEWFFTGYSSRYLQWGELLHGCGSRYLQWRVVLHGLWFTVFAMASGSSRVLWFTVFAMAGGSSRVMVHGICNDRRFFTGYGSRYLQ